MPASVLIIDPDSAIRGLVEIVLQRAGFHTATASDLDAAAALLETSSFAVIVRDLNLAPSQRRRALQRLTATAPELLRRTIVMTTAPARATTAMRAATVFAVVGKPFDIDKLVQAVTACARDSRPRSQIESLQRFVNNVPSLQHLLSMPVSCDPEALLRTEMRRTLDALSATLLKAARVEGNSRAHEAVFRAASMVAARLAASPAPTTRGGRA